MGCRFGMIFPRFGLGFISSRILLTTSPSITALNNVGHRVKKSFTMRSLLADGLGIYQTQQLGGMLNFVIFTFAGVPACLFQSWFKSALRDFLDLRISGYGLWLEIRISMTFIRHRFRPSATVPPASIFSASPRVFPFQVGINACLNHPVRR